MPQQFQEALKNKQATTLAIIQPFDTQVVVNLQPQTPRRQRRLDTDGHVLTPFLLFLLYPLYPGSRWVGLVLIGELY